jgi:hypothetical protein
VAVAVVVLVCPSSAVGPLEVSQRLSFPFFAFPSSFFSSLNDVRDCGGGTFGFGLLVEAWGASALLGLGELTLVRRALCHAPPAGLGALCAPPLTSQLGYWRCNSRDCASFGKTNKLRLDLFLSGNVTFHQSTFHLSIIYFAPCPPFERQTK